MNRMLRSSPLFLASLFVAVAVMPVAVGQDFRDFRGRGGGDREDFRRRWEGRFSRDRDDDDDNRYRGRSWRDDDGGGFGRGGFGRGGFDRGGFGRGRFGGFGGGPGGGDFIRHFDANGNHIIEPNELNDFSRRIVERAGLDPNSPIPVERLQSAMEELRRERFGGGRDNDDDDDDRSSESSSDKKDKKSDSDDGPRLVPGFGESVDLPPVPGFGAEPLWMAMIAMNEENSSSNGNNGSSGNGNGDSDRASRENRRERPFSRDASAERGDDDDNSNRGYRRRGGSSRNPPPSPPSPPTPPTTSAPSPPLSAEERSRKWAADKIKEYDKNGNDVLEPDEWAKISGGERFDKDGDGKITLEELAGGPGSAKPSNDDGNRRPSSGDSTTGRPNVNGDSRGDRDSGDFGSGGGRRGRGRFSNASSVSRFYTPADRLPEGLPNWFFAKDADGDGQISMHEFTSSWSDAQVERFARYDRNGDGVVTPQEYLAAEED